MVRRMLLALAVLPALAFAACDDQPRSWAEEAKALEGGTALPEGAGTVVFPWIGKQSVMCVGDSVERQIAFVDFTDDAHEALGRIELDAAGRGKGSLLVKAADLRTGHTGRDEKLQGPSWLDAASHPDVSLVLDGLERVKPTVWKATGTWTMNGVSRPVEFLANVRWIGAMQNVAEDGVVRVSASFPISLKAHDVGGEWVGTPAVAATWDVNVVLLGVMTRK